MTGKKRIGEGRFLITAGVRGARQVEDLKRITC